MDEVVVARIGKAHGLKGEVTVQVHTDSPEERFVAGAAFVTDPAHRGPLTLRSTRVHNGIYLLAFEEAPDRTAAEGLRGINLLAAADDLVEDDAWYEEDLLGFDLDRLGRALVPERDGLFRYLGLQTLYDRYFIHRDEVRYELPQVMFMRVAMGLALNEDDREARAIEAKARPRARAGAERAGAERLALARACGDHDC